MWRQRGSLAEAARQAVTPVDRHPRGAGGLAPSYRASCSRGEFVGGEREGLVAEVGVKHFLEDEAAVGKQQSSRGERTQLASLL